MKGSALNDSGFSSYVTEKDLDIDAFSKICSRQTLFEDYPLARELRENILVYEASDLLEAFLSEEKSLAIKEELYQGLKEGPGVFIIKGFYAEKGLLDENTAIFKQIIQEEKAFDLQTGDHFAKAGANERIWNSFQKVAEKSISAFIDYYKNPLYAVVSEAWLGPGYQITAQVNIVKPGGKAQSPHRDYHMGFIQNEQVAAYPLAMQIASQYLTLQGAIAHSDMPQASGPTLLLPFSHQYPLGYLAYREEKFIDYFLAHAVQIPLEKGDAMFFSPALFHGAGSNHTESDRIANLIQVSSAFGKTMESIDRYKLVQMSYGSIVEKIQLGEISDAELCALLAAMADSYPFPTNLDLMPPLEGYAPDSLYTLLEAALNNNLSEKEFLKQLEKHQSNRRA